MGKKAITSSTAKRPANGDPQTEEALRVQDSRMDQLEALTKPGVTPQVYDDTYIKNLLSRLRRDLDEHSHRRQTASEAGDTYAGPFKLVKKDGEDLVVTVEEGRYIAGATSAWAIESDVIIPASTDTYYIVFQLTYDSGYAYTFEVETDYPDQSDEPTDIKTIRIVIGVVSVTDSVTDILNQWHTGEIHIAGRVV
jgi:hypothetical protein